MSARTRTKTGRGSTAAVATVDVVVVVNHGELRRGERGTVELTEVVRRRLDSGYLRLADTPADPTAPALGAAVATREAEPRGVLLGVDGPPQVVMTSGGERGAASGTGQSAG